MGSQAACLCRYAVWRAIQEAVRKPREIGMNVPKAPATSVALIEDDLETRERLAASVRAQGSLELVAEYRSGTEALAGLASRAPDVLLVDLGLPDMSGLELIRFAAERYPECDI